MKIVEEIDLKEVLNYFKSRIAWIIITVLLVVAVGNVYRIFTRKPLYKSETSIVLVNNSSTANSSYTDLQVNKNLVSTYSEIIKSRKVLEPVIDNLELDYGYATLRSKVSVAEVTDTEIIKVSVSDKKPEKARDIANEIADVFSKEVQEIYKLDNVSIVDKAVIATSPYNINHIKDNVIFIAIGLIVSCGIIFIVFYFDTTIKTSEEIENKLGLTIIGTVPNVDKE